MKKEELDNLYRDLQMTMKDIGVKFLPAENSPSTKKFMASCLAGREDIAILSTDAKFFNRHAADQNKVFFVISCTDESDPNPNSNGNNIEAIAKLSKAREILYTKLIDFRYTNRATKHVVFLGKINSSVIKRFVKANPEKHCWLFGLDRMKESNINRTPMFPKVETTDGSVKIGLTTLDYTKTDFVPAKLFYVSKKDAKFISTEITRMDIPNPKSQLAVPSTGVSSIGIAKVSEDDLEAQEDDQISLSGCCLDAERDKEYREYCMSIFDHSIRDNPVEGMKTLCGVPLVGDVSLSEEAGQPSLSGFGLDPDDDEVNKEYWASFFETLNITNPAADMETPGKIPLLAPPSSEEVGQKSRAPKKPRI